MTSGSETNALVAVDGRASTGSVAGWSRDCASSSDQVAVQPARVNFCHVVGDRSAMSSEVPQERGHSDEKARPAAATEARVLGHESAGSQCLDRRVAVHASDASVVGSGDGCS